ncbi:hypothetical protein HK405_007026 [Cladochytrium tenue]|nr:hypothetical protein HK405_007026 [Cladochytrium tenue]
MFASPAVRLIQHLPLHQLALLLAVAKIARRSGVPETTAALAFEQYESYCRSLRVEPERSAGRHELLALLYEARFVLADPAAASEPGQRVRLLVGEPDLAMAVRLSDAAGAQRLKELLDR